MEILMSGEIYLKRGPEIIERDPIDIIEDDFDSNENYEEEEKFEKFVENLRKNSNVSNDFIEDFIRYHESEKKVKQEMNNYEICDYSGCESFWMSIISNNQINLVEEGNGISKPSKLTFKTKEKLDEQFLRLRVFLEKAEYVGKKFRRTEPAIYRTQLGMSQDMSFIYNPVLVLYATRDHMIILNEKFSGEKRFSIISSKYLKDGNFLLEGEINNEYRDKSELYHAIFKQFTDRPKKKL